MKVVPAPIGAFSLDGDAMDVATVDGDVRPRAPEVEAEPSPPPLAPVPSGAELARRAKAIPGVATTSVLGARTQALAGVSGVDGRVALAARLDEIEEMAKHGTVRCVFDLDNTVFDTRWRTLWCAQEFARQNPEAAAWFDGAMVDAMQIDGRETAIKLGAPDDVVEAFGAFWDREFWNPDNLVHDRVIPAMVELIDECKRRGAVVSFLTGRCDRFVHPNAPERGEQSFRPATHAQLAREGIDVADDELSLKPGLGMWTPQFKQGQLQAWGIDGDIGLFVTEGRRDLDHLQAQIPILARALFRLDCSFEETGPACTAIPVLPRVF